MALGTLGHVHADSIGWLEHRAGLFGGISSVELSLASPAAERSDANESNVDDLWRFALDRYRLGRITSCTPPLHRMDHSHRHLFLRCGYLLYLRQRRRFSRDGEHAPLRILRAHTDRARFLAFSASISRPAAAAAGVRDGCRGVNQRPWAERAGLVYLEFYSRELGGVTKNE